MRLHVENISIFAITISTKPRPCQGLLPAAPSTTRWVCLALFLKRNQWKHLGPIIIPRGGCGFQHCMQQEARNWLVWWPRRTLRWRFRNQIRAGSGPETLNRRKRRRLNPVYTSHACLRNSYSVLLSVEVLFCYTSTTEKNPWIVKKVRFNKI